MGKNQIPFDNIRACIAGTCSLEPEVRKNDQQPAASVPEVRKNDQQPAASPKKRENSMCPGFVERLRNHNGPSSSFGLPYRWPSLALIFFVGIVASMIGYGATTLREDRKLTWQGGTLSATIAFGFLLALKSGYGLAFSSSTEIDPQNVMGLAFMGFIVGLFTEQVFKLLETFVPKTKMSARPNDEVNPDPPTLPEDQPEADTELGD